MKPQNLSTAVRTEINHLLQAGYIGPAFETTEALVQWAQKFQHTLDQTLQKNPQLAKPTFDIQLNAASKLASHAPAIKNQRNFLVTSTNPLPRYDEVSDKLHRIQLSDKISPPARLLQTFRKQYKKHPPPNRTHPFRPRH